MLKWLIAAGVVLLSTQFTSAQSVEIRDLHSREPLPFVHISCLNASEGLNTDVNGKTSLENLSCDSLLITYLGYQDLLITRTAALAQKTLYLKTDPLPIFEVVIAANHWEEERDKVPNQIADFSRVDVQLTQPQTAADLLDQHAGVYAQKSQYGGGSPMIRGFAANRVLISVNGTRMNNAIFRSGNLQNLLSLDPFLVERGEVLFGPGTVIYGSDAIGGVMDFHLLTTPFSDKPYLKGEASVRYASASNENTAHLHFKYGGKNWSGISSFSYNRFGDLRMGKNGPDEYLQLLRPERINDIDSFVVQSDPRLQSPSGFNIIHLYQKFSYRYKKSEFSYDIYHSSSSDYSRYDRIIQTRNGAPRYSEWYYGPQVWTRQELSWKNQGKTRLTDQFEVKINHQYFAESRHSRRYQASVLSTQRENVNMFSAVLKAEKKLSRKSRLFYGTEMNFNVVRSTAVDEDLSNHSSTEALSRYPDSSTMNIQAVYVALRHELSTKHSLSAGIRANFIQLKADNLNRVGLNLPNTNLITNAVNGSLGLNSKWSRKFQSFLNLSTAFRSPNVDDISKVFESTAGDVVIPNPDLSPEYALNGEIGFMYQSNRRLKLETGFYFTHLMNALVIRPTLFNGIDSIEYQGEWSKVSSLQNAAYTQIAGAWLKASYQWDEVFSSGLQFNFQYGNEYDNGIASAARHANPPFGQVYTAANLNKMRIRFVYRFALEQSYDRLALTERDKAYLYALDNFDRPYTPAWSTLNLYFEYAINNYNSLSLAWENIANQRYRPYSSGITAPGSNLIVSWRLHF
ncbi:MAG: TonB-dependent receptor [Bacteroidetes bacterium]|nr:MAG: TonB-dependent receptor [Bacteroidota bacterium]